MKLYEIDERIEEITALLEPDCNGELPINFIELCNKLDALVGVIAGERLELCVAHSVRPRAEP